MKDFRWIAPVSLQDHARVLRGSQHAAVVAAAELGLVTRPYRRV
jgi:hypothetical protein